MKSKTVSVALALAIAIAGLSMLPLTASAEAGDWLVRGGFGIADPDSGNLDLEGAELNVDSATSLTVDGTYMFADHWGAELMTAYPFSHDYSIDGAGAWGEVEQMPIVLSLQYHFNPDGTIRPYIGAGVNYTLFTDESTLGSLSGTDLSLDDSWGAAGQVGVDIGLSENFFLNLAVRYLQMEPDANIDGDDVGSVDVNPFIYQLQFGYRFGKPKPAPVAAAVAAPVVAAAAPPPPPPPADSDGDGVIDTADQCPDTPRGDRVGEYGCSCDITRQLQFALNSADLTDEDKAQLDEMAVNLTRLKFVAGTVVGHTDSSGAEAYNQKLSERRAQTVADYLQAKGVAVGRLAASGAGESEPIADNATKEGRAQNRRVVLKRTDCDAGK